MFVKNPLSVLCRITYLDSGPPLVHMKPKRKIEGKCCPVKKENVPTKIQTISTPLPCGILLRYFNCQYLTRKFTLFKVD